MKQSKEIFTQLLRLPKPDRESALAELCGSDHQLLTDVQRLLASSEGRGLLDGPLLFWSGRFRPGEVVGPYEIECLVGHGGSSEVYRARHSVSDRIVALKVLFSKGLSDRERQRFSREAQSAQACLHPSLVDVIEYGDDRAHGVLYLVMPFVKGPNLAQVLRAWNDEGYRPNGRDRQRIVDLLIQVGDALRCLHGVKLIHGDVKPANIILEGATPEEPWLEGSRVVLVDLGLAWPLGGDWSTQHMTKDYAAPEQVKGSQVDGRTDVFSLGLTAYDMISGRLPKRRAGPTANELREPEPLENVVPDLEEDLARIIQVAIEPGKRSRYGSMDRFLADLRAWKSGRPVRARRMAIWRDLRRWARQHPGKAVRAGAVSLGMLTLLALATVAALTTLARAHGLEKAWEQGDYAGFRSLGSDAGNLPIRWILNREAWKRLNAIRRRDSEDVVVQVLQVLDRDGELAAFGRAASLLERDGITRHPELVRFLDYHWLSAPDRPSRTALIARLFYEHPNETASENRLRRLLMEDTWSVLRDPRTRRERHEALTILGGSGELDELHELNRFLSRWLLGDRESAEAGLSFLESTLRAQGEILRRARILGDHRTWPRQRVLDLLSEIRELFRSCASLDARLDFSFAFRPLCRQLASLARGRFPEAAAELLPDLSVPHRGDVLAILQNEAFRKTLLAGPVPHHLVLKYAGPEIADKMAGELVRYGEQVALYDDAELSDVAPRQAEAFGLKAGLSPERSRALLEEGITKGHEWLDPTVNPNLPDEGTHLGDGLQLRAWQPEISKEELTWPIPGEPRRFEFGWDFTGSKCRVKDGEVVGQNVWSVADEASHDGARHLRLRNPGVSQVVLTLPSQSYPGCLHIDAQKSQRWPLFETGIATLEVYQNERWIQSNRVFQKAEIPVRFFDDGTQDVWTFKIRLSADSTTTARLHRAWVHIVYDGIDQNCIEWPEEKEGQ